MFEILFVNLQLESELQVNFLVAMMDNKHFFVELNYPNIQGKSFDVEIHDEFFQEMGGYINKGNISANAVCKKADDNELV